MTLDSFVHIRLATIGDQDFIVSLIPRLTEFGPPIWRDVERMTQYDSQIIIDSLQHPSDDNAIFIAEDEGKISLGLINLFLGNDYYNKEKHGHVSDLIVAHGAEGKGVGLKLLEHGEAWARSKGFRWLTLGVFAQNQRARELYQRLGFGEDIVKYVKVL